MKRYQVVFTAEAGREYEREVAKWRDTHPKNTYLLEEEVDFAIKVMTATPRIGEAAGDKRLPEARRVVLGKSEHLLYFYVYDDERLVELLSLWYAPRGTRPNLVRRARQKTRRQKTRRRKTRRSRSRAQ